MLDPRRYEIIILLYVTIILAHQGKFVDLCVLW